MLSFSIKTVFSIFIQGLYNNYGGGNAELVRTADLSFPIQNLILLTKIELPLFYTTCFITTETCREVCMMCILTRYYYFLFYWLLTLHCQNLPTVQTIYIRRIFLWMSRLHILTKQLECEGFAKKLMGILKQVIR